MAEGNDVAATAAHLVKSASSLLQRSATAPPPADGAPRLEALRGTNASAFARLPLPKGLTYAPLAPPSRAVEHFASEQARIAAEAEQAALEASLSRRLRDSQAALAETERAWAEQTARLRREHEAHRVQETSELQRIAADRLRSFECVGERHRRLAGAAAEDISTAAREEE